MKGFVKFSDTPEYKNELEQIIQIIGTVESCTQPELNALGQGALKAQPAFPSIFSLFHKNCNYTKDQLDIILRHIVAIWLYYEERLTLCRQIDDALYRKMKQQQKAWGDKNIKDKPLPTRIANFQAYIDNHAAGGLLFTLYTFCVFQPKGAYRTFSDDERYFIFDTYLALINCAESLINETLN